MRFSTKTFFAALLCSVLALAGCSKDDPSKPGNYGELGNNLITIGSTRDITYTSCVLLGTVDFPKITSDHTYGVVILEDVDVADFDYDSKLICGGHNDRYDKVEYNCVTLQVNNSAADGKFEKQLIHLKPATTYYYRAYVAIGQNINYSKVGHFTTQDPSSEMSMSATAATDIFAVSGAMNGVVNVGKLQDVNENQKYGFVYTSCPELNSPEKLTYEYYQKWLLNHFETDAKITEPLEITTNDNLNGRIKIGVKGLKPGATYYYRSFFSWNGKYFYSPEVMSLTTKGPDEITVGTNPATDVTPNSAMLNASVPFSMIGLESVDGGFLISKEYSNAAEFNMNEAVAWSQRNWYPDAKVFYVNTKVSQRDFNYFISGLDRETTYYVRGFIKLEYEVEESDDDNTTVEDEGFMYIYGSMQNFTTPISGGGGGETNLFEVPITDWGLYRFELMNRVDSSKYTLLNSNDNHDGYVLYMSNQSPYGNGMPYVMYSFEYDYLKASTVIVPNPAAYQDLFNFLTVRYIPFDYDPSDNTYYFRDEANMLIVGLFAEDDTAMAVWMPNNSRNKTSSESAKRKVKQIRAKNTKR